MTVTKQQQLEWLAKTHEEWPFADDRVFMSHEVIGLYEFTRSSKIVTREEWQQERDK